MNRDLKVEMRVENAEILGRRSPKEAKNRWKLDLRLEDLRHLIRYLRSLLVELEHLLGIERLESIVA